MGKTVKTRCYEYRLDQANLDEVMFTKEDLDVLNISKKEKYIINLVLDRLSLVFRHRPRFDRQIEDKITVDQIVQGTDKM